ncbi:nucleoside deaminase [bacterium]|nr:nucleoside deaminase [bacterium]
MKKIIEKMKKMNKKASKTGEVPVSAIIIKDNKIIAAAVNKREKNQDVMSHAEIIAIKKAAKKLKTWKLDQCILYVTLEPCSMCKEIIKQSRIKEVKYLIKNSKNINYKTKFTLVDEKNNEYFENELKNFFKDIRF